MTLRRKTRGSRSSSNANATTRTSAKPRAATRSPASRLLLPPLKPLRILSQTDLTLLRMIEEEREMVQRMCGLPVSDL